jgi:ABC-type sugar transport system ATPase subunit
MDKTVLLKLTNISKAFGGVQALDDVSLDVYKGEVHAIVGENGAGKSTLMKIIAGALYPDSGTIEFEGNKVDFMSPRDASEIGISIVYQDPIFFKELSVLENIYMGEEESNTNGILNWASMTNGAVRAIERMGLSSDIVGKPMSELMLGSQTRVLIARAIHKNVKLLILDEPTAILSQTETDILFKIIKELKKQSVGIIYISHRIAEIFKIAGRISVLRDGRKVASYLFEDATEDKLVFAMTGRKLSFETQPRSQLKTDTPLVVVKHLTRVGFYHDVSFEIKPGEILGFYGLVGAGRSEVAKAIYGEMLPDEGDIIFKDKIFSPRNSRDAIDQGIVYVPEDRRHQGLFLIRSIQDNLSAGLLRSISNRFGIINKQKELSLVQEQIDNLKIKLSSIIEPVSSLSGGNQQKVVLGRGLTHKPSLLILDEPTHGIDVATKNEIHKLIVSLAESDIAIILISSDLPEVLSLADNLLIMYEGKVEGCMSRAEATEESVLRLTLGLNRNSLIKNVVC